MKTDIKNIDSTTREITVTIDEAGLKHAKDATLKQLQPDVSAPGFRKGKAPLNVVEKQADQDYLKSQVVDHALNDAFNQVAKEHSLRAVGQPQVEVRKFVPFTELEALFRVAVVGDMELPDYKKISVKRDEVVVGRNEVDDVVESLRARMAERQVVERPAEEGDEVTIDFEGHDKDGKAVAGASGKNFDLALGSKTFIPGFEENLIGAKAGDKKEFEVTFPKDYAHKPLAGAKVTFKVSVHKVSAITKPPADDKLAAKAGPFKTIDELRTDVEKQLFMQKEKEQTAQYRDKLIGTIAEKSKIDIPSVLVDEEMESQMLDLKQNLTYRGMTLEEYLAQLGTDEQSYREGELRERAEKRVKGGLVLSEIAQREKITVTPEEMEIRLQLLKGQYQSDEQMQQQLNTNEARQNVYSQLMTEKTMALLESFGTKK